MTIAATLCEPEQAVDVSASEFSRAILENRDALLRFALRLSRNPHDAEDLVQETVSRALVRRDALQDTGKALTWMMSILHNLFIDQCRRRKTETSKLTQYRELRVLQSAPPPDREPPPRWTMVSDEQVANAVARLSKKLRTVYDCKAKGLSYDDIATQLGVSRNTVGTRLMRARTALRKLLEREADRS